ncbi:hypothetical protein [Nocardia brasiliensis]|uniref:hypothetical protein n=1 Tax=Nocardia brasiliensis TaxID=37326 RepID=UPI0024577170|nr:hypothetical protein [Nocardia brasiliensis]
MTGWYNIRITGVYPDGENVRFTAETRPVSTDSEADRAQLRISEEPRDGDTGGLP